MIEKTCTRHSKEFIFAMNSILQTYVNDNTKIKLVSITGIDVDKYFSNATFFLSILGEDEKNFLDTIEKNKKQIRFLFGQKIKNKVKKIPNIYFSSDDSIKKGFEIEKVIQNLKI